MHAPQRMHWRVWRSTGRDEDRGALIVKQDHVEGLWTIAGSHAGPERGVWIHALPCGGTGEDLKHDRKVLKARQDLLNSGDGDHGTGEGETHAAIGFGLYDGDRAGFRDEEVGATDRGGDGQEFLAEIGAGGRGENLWVVGEVCEAHVLGENLAHLAAIDVQRGNNDMGRLVPSQLQNDFGEISFELQRATGSKPS